LWHLGPLGPPPTSPLDIAQFHPHATVSFVLVLAHSPPPVLVGLWLIWISQSVVFDAVSPSLLDKANGDS